MVPVSVSVPPVTENPPVPVIAPAKVPDEFDRVRVWPPSVTELPPTPDSVVMVEYTSRETNAVEIRQKVLAGENVVATGAEAHRGDQLLAAGMRLDYSAIAVAAAVEKDNSIRVGVGGMAGRPMVRVITGGTAGAISKWAEELEGYEDLHASAALRRDLFKKLGPHVIAQATGGKA